MTSAIGLFLNLGLRTPLRPATGPSPLLIYGASSTVGAYAIKLAKIANIHPIIGVAGSSSDFAKSLELDAVIDYRRGNVVQDIKDALAKHAPGQKLLHVYDAISEGESGNHIGQVADDGASITYVQAGLQYSSPKKKFTVVSTSVGDAHHKEDESRRDFAYVYFRLFGKWLGEGKLTMHPHEVVPGGLDGVFEGLKRLQENKQTINKWA